MADLDEAARRLQELLADTSKGRGDEGGNSVPAAASGGGEGGTRGTLPSSSKKATSRSRSRSRSPRSTSRSRSPSDGSRSSRSYDDDDGRSYSSGSRSSYATGDSVSDAGSRGGGRGRRGGSNDDDSASDYSDYSDSQSDDSTAISQYRRPRPIDLWRAAHEADIEDPRPPVVLTEEGWRDVVDRLGATATDRHTKQLHVEHRQLANEMRNLTFTPRTCVRSRELSANTQSLIERTKKQQERKKQKVDKAKAELARVEMQVSTFQPDLKTPCICHVGVGLRNSTGDKNLLESHTPVCLSFMTACESVNANTNVQLMTDKMKRKVAHLQQYKEYQTIRAQQRRQILEDVENRELTFKPLINRNAKELAMRRKFRMAAAEAQGVAKAPTGMFESPDKRKVLRKKDKKPRPDPGHEQETFTPSINKRSRTMLRPDPRAVHTRLYEAARNKFTARRMVSEAALAEARGDTDKAARMRRLGARAARDAGRHGAGARRRTVWADPKTEGMKMQAATESPRALSRRHGGKVATVVWKRDKHAFIFNKLVELAEDQAMADDIAAHEAALASSGDDDNSAAVPSTLFQ